MIRLARAALAVALLIILPAIAAAQQAGVKAGVNFATLTDASDLPNSSQRLGLVGGVWVRLTPVNRFSFQIEGLFSEKGIQFGVEEDGLEAEADIRLRYLELPLLARADFGATGTGTRVFVVGGVAPAFKTGARIRAEFEGEEETEDISDDIESMDLGLVGGIGVQFGRALVEARYTHGLMSIAADEEEGDEPVKNRVFSVTIGFRFR